MLNTDVLIYVDVISNKQSICFFPGMEFFCTVPRLHFLGRALIWPGCFGERILDVFGLYSSSLSKSVGFVSLSGKASLVSISAAILFLRSWHVYFPLEFEFRGKSCVE